MTSFEASMYNAVVGQIDVMSWTNCRVCIFDAVSVLCCDFELL